MDMFGLLGLLKRQPPRLAVMIQPKVERSKVKRSDPTITRFIEYDLLRELHTLPTIHYSLISLLLQAILFKKNPII